MSLGSFPSQGIKKLMETEKVIGGDLENIQPSSLDMTISGEIYKMKGIFLPKKGEKISEVIKEGALFKSDLNKPLECGGVYLIKLKETLNLPEQVFALNSNKSSTGRVNLQARLLTDGVAQFDRVPRGYKGDLWLLVSPRSFSIKLYEGNTLNQIRFFDVDARLSENEHMALYKKFRLFYDKNKKSVPIENVDFDNSRGLTMTVDLDQDLVGYKCNPSATKILDFNSREHDPLEFFEPIMKPKNGHIILQRDHFYILSTKEHVRVPKEYAMEMIAYDTSKGEFRSHYAGFIDPGWGYGLDGKRRGTPLVLEVFTHDNDFVLRDGQPICKVVYEVLTDTPDVVYGTGKAGSHYHLQRGPRLSKHFKTK